MAGPVLPSLSAPPWRELLETSTVYKESFLSFHGKASRDTRKISPLHSVLYLLVGKAVTVTSCKPQSQPLVGLLLLVPLQVGQTPLLTSTKNEEEEEKSQWPGATENRGRWWEVTLRGERRVFQ